MRQATILKATIKRGNRHYVEIENCNQRLQTALQRLNNKNEISAINKAIIQNYINDVGSGRYINRKSKKGIRSNSRLLKLVYILQTFNKWFNKPLIRIKQKDAERVFNDLSNDRILKKDGSPYKDKDDIRKEFSAFWHWNMTKTFKEKGERIEDITEYLTTPAQSRAKFVYFTLQQLKEVINNATNNENIKAIFYLLFDLGTRPSEFYNLRLSDIKLDKDNKYLITIPEEISKTYGRTIKLWLFSNVLKSYLERHDFKDDDLLFIKYKTYVNRKLVDINKNPKVIELTKGLDKKLSLYDFRHSSACYYLNKYPNAKDMKYRYGWKKESEIEYYTNFLGKQDILTEEDMLSPEDRNQLEKDLINERRAREELEIRLKEQQDILEKIQLVLEMKKLKEQLSSQSQ